MNWLLNILIVWISIDIVVIATGWYILEVIMVQFPNWSRRVICDDGPELEPELEPEFDDLVIITNDSISLS